MIEASPSTRARSHAAADAGSPRGVNPQADRGDEPALLASATAWEGLSRGCRTVGLCGRGSQSRQKAQPPGHPCFLQGSESTPAMQSLHVWGQFCYRRGWRLKAESSADLGVPHASHIPSGHLHGPWTPPWSLTLAVGSPCKMS